MFYHGLPHSPSWSLHADSLDIDLSPDMPGIKKTIVYYYVSPLYIDHHWPGKLKSHDSSRLIWKAPNRLSMTESGINGVYFQKTIKEYIQGAVIPAWSTTNTLVYWQTMLPLRAIPSNWTAPFPSMSARCPPGFWHVRCSKHPPYGLSMKLSTHDHPKVHFSHLSRHPQRKLSLLK